MLATFSRLTSFRGLCLATSYKMSTAAAEGQPGKVVVTEKLDKVFVIGINRPEKRNCVNFETAQALIKAFEEFENDADSHVAILHGIGGTFCAGYDLSEFTAAPKVEDYSGVFTPIDRKPMGPSAMKFSKPTIAAVNGYAVAGGLELALLCDLRVVEETAIMGVFCRRFGVPLIDGGTVRLPKMIGLSRALDLILTGRPVGAKEALEMGLANRVVACGTAYGQAIQLANSLLKFPQECMRADRTSAYYSSFDATSQNDAITFEFENAKHVLTKESAAGASAFVSGVGRHGKFNFNLSKM